MGWSCAFDIMIPLVAGLDFAALSNGEDKTEMKHRGPFR